jgi:hypothetical protein
MIRRIVTLVTAMLMILPLTAVAALAADEGEGSITIVHGIPDVAVDVYVNGDELLPGFEFGTVTDPVQLPAGEYAVDIYAAGADPMVDDSILSGVVQLGPGMSLTAVAHLTYDPATPTLSVFLNDESIVPGANARLTVRHLADAPNVDVRAGGGVLFGEVANGESGTTQVPAGDYPVDLTLPGDNTPVFDAGTLSLAGGVAYTVYAVGTFPDTFTLLVDAVDELNPAAAYGTVSVVHGIPGVTVDVYLNGVLTIPGFAPESIVGPVLLPATAYNIALYATGADPVAEAPIVTGYAELPTGANVSIVAHLDEAPAPVLAVFVNDVTEAATADVRLAVRHTANAPVVDVYANGGELIPDLGNGDSVTADVPAATYGVELYADGVTPPADPAFDAGDLSLAAGTSYVVYAIGNLGSDFSLLIQTISGLGPDGSFGDDNGSVHEPAINALARAGIVVGTGADTYGEANAVTRGQLASIIARSLGLSSDVNAFADDDGSVHEAAINALAAAGIMLGKSDGSSGVNDSVNRGQAASFIARALGLSGGPDAFADDDGSVHEAAINALAAAGITQGKTDGRYGPADVLSRGQMASLWARAIGLAS